MYGFEGVGLSGVQCSISELSVVGGWWVVVGGWTRQTHFMVGPGRGPTKIAKSVSAYTSWGLGSRSAQSWLSQCLSSPLPSFFEEAGK